MKQIPYFRNKGLIVLILLIYICCFSKLSYSQPVNYTQPPNSSYLAEYGLSPKVFNLLISPMYQEEYVFKGISFVDLTTGNRKVSETYEVVYDPFYEYGLTLKMIVHDPKIYETTSKSKMKQIVGKMNEKYKKIRDQNVIEENDVGLVRDNGKEVILGFKLQKENLPPSLKYMHQMDGRVFVIDGILDRIELSLSSPGKIGKIDATEAGYTVTFYQMPDGGYLLENVVQSTKGIRNGEPAELYEKLEITSYHDHSGKLIKKFDTNLVLETVQDFAPDTLKVKLERSLPLLGNAARKAGYELPLPWGVDLFTHFQREVLGLEKVVLNGDDLTNEVLAPGESSATAITNLVAARADVWILPFFNVTIMSGYIFGNTDIKLTLSDEVKEILDIAGVNADNIVVNTQITGPMLGGGFTAAGGYKNLFATVNAMYIHQFVTEANTEVSAIAVTPLIGVRFPKIVNFVVGGQYQLYNSNVSGNIDIEGETLNYEVELKATHWNWLVGLQRDFSNHWNGSIMMGFEPRPQTTIVLGYRF